MWNQFVKSKHVTLHPSMHWQTLFSTYGPNNPILWRPDLPFYQNDIHSCKSWCVNFRYNFRRKILERRSVTSLHRNVSRNCRFLLVDYDFTTDLDCTHSNQKSHGTIMETRNRATCCGKYVLLQRHYVSQNWEMAWKTISKLFLYYGRRRRPR